MYIGQGVQSKVFYNLCISAFICINPIKKLNWRSIKQFKRLELLLLNGQQIISFLRMFLLKLYKIYFSPSINENKIHIVYKITLEIYFVLNGKILYENLLMILPHLIVNLDIITDLLCNNCYKYKIRI